MINLRVSEECHGCPEFEVEQEDLYADNTKFVILTCAHFDKCRRIKAYLEKEANNEKR